MVAIVPVQVSPGPCSAIIEPEVYQGCLRNSMVLLYFNLFYLDKHNL